MSARYAFAMPSATSPMRLSMKSRSSLVRVRAVPSISTVSGMMLKAEPPRILPTETTAGLRGSFSREMTSCRPLTM